MLFKNEIFEFIEVIAIGHCLVFILSLLQKLKIKSVETQIKTCSQSILQRNIFEKI